MTRFARAKGSKASNERIPDDATPWHVMKQQLVENLEKKQGTQEKVKSAKELLREKEDPYYSSSIGNINNDWAEFEESGSKTAKPKSNGNATMEVGKKKKKSKLKKENALGEEAKQPKENEKHVNNKIIEKSNTLKRKSNQIDDSTNETETKKQKKGKKQLDNTISTQNDNVNLDTSVTKKPKKKKANLNEKEAENDEVHPGKNKLHKKRKREEQSVEKFVKASSGHDNTLQDKQKNSSLNNSKTNEKNEGILSKRQKRNMKNKNKNTNETVHQNDGNIENEKNKYSAPKFNKSFVNRSNEYNNASNKFGIRKFDAINKNNMRKPPKIRDDKEHKRRKPDTGPTKMTINGVDVEIVKYDGFPVRKADADRLKDLKQQMIMKGIPKKEIDAAMKLERRKAEKALARIRRCVCFHCRKAGHNLSDCPELGTEQAGTGICFKCGSTEHTHFECKVVKATEYRYATCFICREQGHISKQCPDNPKGVYPQGGACKICGDVTHLKKDCPDLVKEKEQAAITLDTIANDTVEHLEEDKRRVEEKANKSSKKIVKF